MTDELKPCPFCGTAPKYEAWTNERELDVGHFSKIHGCCKNTGTGTVEWFITETKNTEAWEEMCDKHVAQWNTRAQPQWVSVDERLPDIPMPSPDGVYSEGSEPVLAFTQGEQWVAQSWSDGSWLDPDGAVVLEHVTHWMPLPAPPTDEPGEK